MKKIILYISSLMLFITCFLTLGLKSYAIVTVEPETNGFSEGVLKYSSTDSGRTYIMEYDISENSSYNRLGIVCYFNSWTSEAYHTESWRFINVLDLLNSTTSNEPFAYVTISADYVDGNGSLYDPYNDYWITDSAHANGQSVTGIYTNDGYFNVDFPVFESKEKAIDYYRYGLLDDESIRYGEEYISDTSFSEIQYDPLEIPAPHVEWVADSNGDFTHQLHFLNNGYFGEHNEQLNYGLLLSMHWLSVNEASLAIAQNQGAYTRYQFTANDFCFSDEVKVYSMPMGPFNFNDYKCPPYLNLDTNGLCINGFNEMLSAYPIANRNFVTSSNQSNANFVLGQIRDHLDEINYKLNCPIVSCQYFVVDDNRKFIKGPITKIRISYPNPCYYADTGAELGYDKSEVQTWNPETDAPLSDPTVINPPSSPKPGPVDPYEVPDYTKADPSDLIENMTGLFGLVGQMPTFVAQLISFLPDWILQFIAVSLGLAIVIGIVKLFIG